MRTIKINPLLGKEMRLSMRSWRTFGMVSLYLLGLGGLAVLFFLATFSTFAGSYNDLAEIGANLFAFLSVLQFILVVFLVPALVGNAISGERERQTLDLLTCTQLTPFRIVVGKLTAALSTVVLLIFASLPLYGFVFLLGGVSPLEVLTLFCIILAVALLVGCWSLMFSALFRRTVAAIVASYALILFLLGGSSILFTLLASIFYQHGNSLVALVLVFNPLTLLGWLYTDFFKDLISSLGSSWTQWGVQIWHLALIAQTVLAAVSLWTATQAVDPLKGKKHKG